LVSHDQPLVALYQSDGRPSHSKYNGEKMKLLSILVLLVISPIALAQQSNPSALKEMVETEQAFSKTARVKNTRDAFMEFIADDGLLPAPAILATHTAFTRRRTWIR